MSVRDFQERKKVERILFSLPVLVIFATLVVLALWGVARIGYRKYILDQETAKFQSEIAALEAQRAEYEELLSRLSTPEGLDREARGKFNLKKEGEKVVLFLESSPAQSIDKESGAAGIWHSLKDWTANLFR